MNNRSLSRSAIVLGVLATLSAAPAFASETILIPHDEGNSGPTVVQAPPQAPATSSAQTNSHSGLVVRDEGMTSPNVTM
ncbi:MAG TPA: hypothetical protein VL974_04350 [Magnetospirillum sp.]|jgi:hypothetical protein|nr:hypothetical protein [Magnetospirillum sp.]